MKKKAITNIIYNSLYRIIVIITPLITAPYLSRVLGASQLGVYTYCYAFALYFSIIPMLGVNDYGNRTIAKTRDSCNGLSDSFWQIYYIQLFLTAVSTIAYLLIVSLKSNDYLSIRLILTLFVFTSAIDINWFAYGLEEFKFTSIRNIIIRVATVIAIFIFVHSETDLLVYSTIITVGNFLSVIPIWFLVKKHTYFIKPRLSTVFYHLKKNCILFLPVIATTIYQQIDKIMLGNENLTTEVGYYQNAENIATLPTFLTTAIVTIMLPYISNLLTKGDKDNNTITIVYKTAKYASILNIAMMFGLIAISYSFIPWYLGKGYERSAELLIILSPLIFINGISNIIRDEYLIPHEMDKLFTISILIGAFANVLLNAVLIPSYYANGAAIATILAYSIVLLLQVFFTWKKISYLRIVKDIFPYLLFGIGMLLLVTFIDRNLDIMVAAKCLLEIAVGGIFYVICCLVYMRLTNDSILKMLQSFKHRKE